MRCLINVSTLRAGGGFQVGINIVKYCVEYKSNEIDFFYLINHNFHDKKLFHSSDNVYLLEDYPSNIFNFRNNKNIKRIINEINPDLIYSVGAPSYINFNGRLEVVRLTNPWLIYKDQIALTKFNLLDRFKLKVSLWLKKQYLNSVDFFITQTNDARLNIAQNLKKDPENIYVIPNVYSYNLEKYLKYKFNRSYDKQINILVFSAYYSHKNIDITIKIANELRSKGINCIKFILTIPDSEYNQLGKKINSLGLNDYFFNKGKISHEDIPNLYLESHILFLPTLLEVFSVTFLEAMLFEVPIVTTNLSFNKTVCEDAALYFEDYLDGRDVLELFFKIINENSLRESLVSRGKQILGNYDKNDDIYSQHIKILKSIYEKI